MRRLPTFALLLATALPAFAQEAPENPPPAEAAPAAPSPAPAEAAPAPAEAAPAPAEATPPAPQPARQAPAPKPTQAAPTPTPAPQAPAPTPVKPPAATSQPAPAAPVPPPAVAAPAPVPTPPPPAQPATPDALRDSLRTEARYLFTYLLSGDVRGAIPLLTFPFQLEERRFDAPEALIASWVKQLRQKRIDLITLYDVEVLSLAELEQKYGKPPARLGAFVPRGIEVYAAVANLSGRPAVVLYRQTPEGWHAFAYTD